MQWCADGSTATEAAVGPVAIAGQVLDGTGAPVTDAVLEFWQADGNGQFPPDTAPGWTGFARVLTDGEGCYRIRTVKPGVVALTDGTPQAPHIDVSIFARGLQQRLVSRLYFADEPAANAEDPLLGSISDAESAATLIAEADDDGYHLDFRMQGDRETIFFVP
jgi:protocatechuate 3,4-dioxygenase alpha subunit